MFKKNHLLGLMLPLLGINAVLAQHEPYTVEREAVVAIPPGGRPSTDADSILQLESGDLDGDGKAELVAVTTSSQRVLTYPRTAGGWGAPVSYDIPSSGYFYTNGVATADMNGDRREDVILWTNQGYRILLSTPSGTRRWVSETTLPVYPSGGVTAGDFNRDGAMDFVVASRQIGDDANSTDGLATLRVVLGDGRGGVRRVIEIPTGSSRVVGTAVGDLNGDGILDIAAVETTQLYFGSGPLTVRYGSGSGGFREPVVLSPLLHETVTIGDFNGDGRLDVASDAGKDRNSRFLARIAIFSQGADRILRRDPTQTRWVFQNATSMEAADLDGDGRDDLLVAHDGWNSVSRYLQRNGRLDEASVFDLGEGASLAVRMPSQDALAAADFDGRGLKDIVAVQKYAGFVSLRSGLRPYAGTARLPLAPTITAIRIDPIDAVVIQFTLPPTDPAAPVLGYEVTADPGGLGIPRHEFVGGPPADGRVGALLFGLELDRPYRFAVRVRNEAGWGPRSPWSDEVVAPDVPSLQITGGRGAERQGGGSVVFRVQATAPALAGGLTFDVSTFEQTAKAGEDFVPVQLRDVHIPQGGRFVDVTVPVLDDTNREQTEVFQLFVDNVRGRTLSNSRFGVTGYIDDNDGDPVRVEVHVRSAEVLEGNGERQVIPFRVELTMPVDGVVRLDIEAREQSTLDSPARAGVDFVAAPPKRFEIPAGRTSMTFDVEVLGDTVIEGDESFEVFVSNVEGASPGITSAEGKILNDDYQSPFARLRPDRYVLTENQGLASLAPHVNDRVPATGLLVLQGDPLASGVLERFNLDSGASEYGHDDRWLVQPRLDATGEGRFVYRACDVEQRCLESTVDVVVRPIPEGPLRIDAQKDSGFVDVEVSRLRPLSAARFEATSLVPMQQAAATLPVDPTPDDPWDVAAGGSRSWFDPITSPAGPQASTWRMLVDVSAVGADDVDLYIGVDADRDGVAERSEVRCVSAMAASVESCDASIVLAPGEMARVWAMVHNAGRSVANVEVHRAVVDLDSRDQRIVASGPGHTLRGEVFPVRIAWNDPTFVEGTRRLAFLKVFADGSTPMGISPVRLKRVGATASPQVLSSGVPLDLVLNPGAASESVFIDVPAGAAGLDVRQTGTGEADLYLSRTPFGEGPIPALAPARSEAVRVSRQAGANESVSVSGIDLRPGRWYVTSVNPSLGQATLRLEANLVGSSTLPRAGSYFNAGRSGHGLFLYPAGSALVGLWYTYLEDGTPTWYYLQSPVVGASHSGVWRSPIYRSAWSGSANRLVEVGQASIVPVGRDAFQFTYTLDGVTGSEPMASLGSGCPSWRGVPLDRSSHWFDPSSAGTGYSVQMWPNYEMHVAFVYDARGMPVFLIAESNGFGGDRAVLNASLLEGFCPTCPRTTAPRRRDVGVLVRTVSAQGFQYELDSIFEGEVPGVWSAVDDVRPLGGDGTTQGCAAP